VLDPVVTHAVLLAHAGATWAMVGLIWFVQIVHYPLMARVGAQESVPYALAHQSRTTRVVAPLMLVEITTAVLLAFFAPPEVVSRTLGLIAVLVLAAIWTSTFLVQVPLHARLARGFSPEVHRRLVLSNWARTIPWTIRGVLALLWLG
jgi:hypothetical protein